LRTVNAVLVSAVGRGMVRRIEEKIAYLGIEEKSSREGSSLNFGQHRITDGCVEGFDSVMQLIKANARGFCNVTNYRAGILFHCGKLSLAMG
jgi:hypothetical protein